MILLNLNRHILTSKPGDSRPTSSGTLVTLLCGPQGLVAALQGLLSAGLRPISRFTRGTPLVWEFVHKVYLEVSEVNTCHPDQPAIQSFVKCVQLLMRPSSNRFLYRVFILTFSDMLVHIASTRGPNRVNV